MSQIQYYDLTAGSSRRNRWDEREKTLVQTQLSPAGVSLLPTVINKSLIFKYSSQFTDSLTSGLSKGFARGVASIYSFNTAQGSAVTKKHCGNRYECYSTVLFLAS